DALRLLSLTPGESVLAAMGGPVLAGLVGAVLGVAGAWFGSQYFPIGIGRQTEPEPGRQTDILVAAGGSVGLVLGVTLLAYIAARGTLRRQAADRPMRRSAVAARTARLGLPVPTILGTRLALEPGRGRTAVPVRPALVGAVAGVLGVVAASTFHAGL